ncbi:MAG: biliverdin-producing heme oxygenase [Phycisphaeraceae bacterium]|nr:biliverdin-producing heme oxygenase [Phycisphaeraceae bacterium]
MSSIASNPPLTLQLREHTAQHHKNAEGRALERSLAAGTLPRDLYLAMLGQRYLIHRVLEKHLANLNTTAPEVSVLIDQQQFLAPHAEADLRHFGVNISSITPLKSTQQLCEQIDQTAAKNPTALVGVHYVFEGSKNGARYLCRIVRQAYGLHTADGVRYMDPHGEQQRPLWEQFKQRLDSLPLEQDRITEIVAAAATTFDGISAIDDELMAGAPPVSASPGHAHRH